MKVLSNVNVCTIYHIRDNLAIIFSHNYGATMFYDGAAVVHLYCSQVDLEYCAVRVYLFTKIWPKIQTRL